MSEVTVGVVGAAGRLGQRRTRSAQPQSEAVPFGGTPAGLMGLIQAETVIVVGSIRIGLSKTTPGCRPSRPGTSRCRQYSAAVPGRSRRPSGYLTATSKPLMICTTSGACATAWLASVVTVN